MKKRISLRQRMAWLCGIAMIPFICIAIYLMCSLVNYSKAYDEIISNMTIANSYNIVFKDQMDESMYKLVVGAVTFETITKDEVLRNPYLNIRDMRDDFTQLYRFSTDKESQSWLMSLLRNLDTLEDSVDDIKVNLDKGGHYEDNIQMLDDDIYMLTDLIQDDLHQYIYYQTLNIDILNQMLRRQLSRFLAGSITLVLIVLISVTGISAAIINAIVRPMKELVEITRQIARGNFQVRASTKGAAEVAALSQASNEMAQKLEIMVNHIKEDEQKMRMAELRLLQEQINPHFLYNTLDAIVWLIESGENNEAEQMVESLSSFFRLVLSKGRDVITLADEKQHIQSYLEIQKVRYQDILEYEIQLPESLGSYGIVKLTLQPLIENSLYHGIKYKRSMGKITISGEKRNDHLILKVEDNGVGMDVDELARLRENIERPCKETERGFGLANVNERLKMYYGPEYGLSIESVKGQGTTVTVTIPAVLAEMAIGKEETI